MFPLWWEGCSQAWTSTTVCKLLHGLRRRWGTAGRMRAGWCTEYELWGRHHRNSESTKRWGSHLIRAGTLVGWWQKPEIGYIPHKYHLLHERSSICRQTQHRSGVVGCSSCRRWSQYFTTKLMRLVEYSEDVRGSTLLSWALNVDEGIGSKNLFMISLEVSGATRGARRSIYRIAWRNASRRSSLQIWVRAFSQWHSLSGLPSLVSFLNLTVNRQENDRPSKADIPRNVRIRHVLGILPRPRSDVFVETLTEAHWILSSSSKFSRRDRSADAGDESAEEGIPIWLISLMLIWISRMI